MGRDNPQPAGPTDRVKGGQNWRANSLPQKPEGCAERFMGMAPLRLAGGSVTALVHPRQEPSGLPCSPVIRNRDHGLWQGSHSSAQRSLGQR